MFTSLMFSDMGLFYLFFALYLLFCNFESERIKRFVHKFYF